MSKEGNNVGKLSISWIVDDIQNTATFLEDNVKVSFPFFKVRTL